MKKKLGVYIGNIFLALCIVLYATLLALYYLGGTGTLINDNSILLASVYFALLILGLFFHKGITRIPVYIFILLNLLFYGQRFIFLYLFPESIRFIRTINYTVDDINKALIYLLIYTAATMIGFKTAEFLPTNNNNNEKNNWLPKWLYRETSRNKFYIIILCSYIAKIIMSVYYQHTAQGALLNTKITDVFSIKLLLHLLLYFNFAQLIIFIILLQPEIRRKTKENIAISLIFILIMVSSLSQGSKAAIIAIALSYFIVKIVMGNYLFKKKTLLLLLIIMFTLPIMGPLSTTVRTSIILGVNSTKQFKEIFKKASTGYADDLIGISSRLGGIDWLAAAVSKTKKNELKDYVNLPSLGKDAANRLIPVPKVFPDKLNMLQQYTKVIWEIPVEQTFKITELPTFFSVLYLLFGYFSVFIVFLWGTLSLIVIKSNVSILIKVLYCQHLMVQLFLGGDIIESVKAFFMALFILWLITLIVSKRHRFIADKTNKFETLTNE